MASLSCRRISVASAVLQGILGIGLSWEGSEEGRKGKRKVVHLVYVTLVCNKTNVTLHDCGNVNEEVHYGFCRNFFFQNIYQSLLEQLSSYTYE